MTQKKDLLEAITVDVHLEDEDPETVLRDIREGLAKTPKELSPRYLYDDRGSALFEEICTLPEYYQTRTERAILEANAREIVRLTGARELVELGSGAATKTRVLLDAMQASKQLRLYVPFDVNEWIVRRTAEELVERYEGLRVHGVIGDFMHHLGHIPDGDHSLIIFLGGTIGNLTPGEADAFVGSVASDMSPGDYFLLGTDLIKNRDRLEAAYNDSRGVTAAFNLNMLDNLNRIAEADFDPANFRHQAIYNEHEHRIEMWLHARREHVVDLAALRLLLPLERGEGIRTEISTKFDRELVDGLLGRAGLELAAWYTDPEELFALSLARKAS